MPTIDIKPEAVKADQREAALISLARVRLITGAPGVGKTYFGCRLAQYELQVRRTIKQSYQSALFLTFARNAVARIRQAYIAQVGSKTAGKTVRSAKAEKDFENRVRIDTFAAFFWWIVDSYGRFAPGGSCLRPWFLGAHKTGADFVPKGHIGYTFDELKECARSILGVEAVRSLISGIYPLVIIDEHQDFDLVLHEITILLARESHLVLLRGPGQCIYRGLHKFDPDEVLRRTEIDLAPQTFEIRSLGIGQQRYCSEIAAFLSQYDSNNTCRYDSRRVQRWLKPLKTTNGNPNPLETHIAFAVHNLGGLLKSIHPDKKSFSIVVLASTNRAVAQIHRRITEGSLDVYGLKPKRASLLFDDTLLLYYGRLVLLLMDGHWISLKPGPINEELVASTLTSFFKAADDACRLSYQDYVPAARHLSHLVSRMTKPTSKTGPVEKIERDLHKVNDFLRATKGKRPKGTPQMPFTKADLPLLKLLTTGFVSSIKSFIKPSGVMNVDKAKVTFEKSLQQRIILEKLGIQKGVEVMTIHKSKGREFDGVVVALENDHTALWRASSGMTDEETDDLYRVAISRARDALIVVGFNDALSHAASPVQKLLR
jgi:DNA helicase-2/ATP-dependent DNA helicase PcrA